MIPGTEIKIGAKGYILPPLGFDGLKRMAETWKTYDEMSEEGKLDALIQMVHAALVRNYPDLALDEVRNSIHAHEVTALNDAMPALFGETVPQGRRESRRASKRK
jgi:hypothetical protein